MSPKRLILSGFHTEIDHMPRINFCACYKVRNDLIIFLFSVLTEIFFVFCLCYEVLVSTFFMRDSIPISEELGE